MKWMFSDKPHNPLINAGAIITTSLCKPNAKDIDARLKEVQ